MPNIFKRLFKAKEGSLRFKQEMADRMNGRHIKYVTERVDDQDIVIGHDGCLAVRNGELIVLSDGVEKFRVKIAEMQASELMLMNPSTAFSCSVRFPSTSRLTRTKSAICWIPARTLTP